MSAAPGASAIVGAAVRVIVVAVSTAVSLSHLLGIVAALPEILGLDVADVQEAVPPDPEVHKGRLNAGFDIDDASLVDVAHQVVLAGSLDIQFLQQAVLDNGDSALLRLGYVVESAEEKEEIKVIESKKPKEKDKPVAYKKDKMRFGFSDNE